MSASVSSALAATPSPPTAASTHRKIHRRIFNSKLFLGSHSQQPQQQPLLRVTNDSRTELSPDPITERSEADKIVDGMDFGELCNEFECISSPLVESTARQLVRDILELREGNRALGTYAVSVNNTFSIIIGWLIALVGDNEKENLSSRSRICFVRSFSGREKYKRPLWVTGALEKPFVAVQEMVMLSTSVLSIKWTIKGRPKSFIASIGGDLIIRVNSKFTLNQISGQVIEHEEFWDLSASSIIAQAFFWTSRRLFATIESGKDLADVAKNLTTRVSTENENLETYPDPSGDPTKFFQRDDSFERDAYQIALLLAVLYFIVQFLRTTL
ncbi:hypothetical protein SLA2020_252310 [Shorea laevis]